jgi:large repetitive protein
MTNLLRFPLRPCLLLLVSAATLRADILANGSFEQGSPPDGGTIESWNVTGNPFGYLTHAPAYTATDGNRMVVFNGGGNVFNGVISQTVATTAGETCTLTFKHGITGTSGRKQRLLVTVTGSTTLVTQTLDITATGTPSLWVARSLTFTADGPTATVSFADGSAAMASSVTGTADMLLDQVSLIAPKVFTLAVASSPPTGVAISCLPADRDGAAQGVTGFTRRYALGSLVTLEAPRFSGAYAFRAWLKDGTELPEGSSTTLTIESDHTLTALYTENLAPSAASDAFTIGRDQSLAVPAPGVLANDNDTDGNALTAVLVLPPAHGTCTLAPDGGFNYTPAPGYSGTDSFTYKASDGGLDSAVASVTVTIVPPDADLVANGGFESGAVVSGSITALADWTVTGNPFGYVADATYTARDGARIAVFNGGNNTFGGSLAQTLRTTPGTTYEIEYHVGIVGVAGRKQRMTVTAAGTSGLFTKTEDRTAVAGAAQWSVVRASFTADSTSTVITFADQSGALGSAAQSCDLLLDRVSVRGTTANRPPVATGDSYQTTQDRSIDIAAAGVLANDTDPDGAPLTAILVSGPAHGTLNLSAGGGFTYTPEPGYSGEDSFTYSADDGELRSSPATVSITIAPSNSSILSNGSFEAGATTSGNVTTLESWNVTGNPFGYLADSAYTATDGTRIAVFNGGNNTFNGSITQTFATTTGQAYRLELDAGVIGAASRRQRLGIQVSGTSSLAQKTEELATSGSTARWSPVILTFVADSASTTLKLSDLSAGLPSTQSSSSDLLLDRLRITPITATGSLRVTSSAGTSVTISASPADLSGKGDGITPFDRVYESGTRVSLTAPATNGNATFRKWTRNGIDLANDTTVTVAAETGTEVTAVYLVDNAPKAADDAFTTDEDGTLSVQAPGVLGNDSDPNSRALTATIGDTTTRGRLELRPDGGFVYTPAPNFHGRDHFTYLVNNGTENSAAATVEITVNPVNDLPIATPATVETREDEAVTLTLEGSDADADELTVTVVTPPTHGVLSGTPPALTYTPAPDFHGDDLVEFTVSDGTTSSAKAAIAIRVTPVADAPVARGGMVTLAAGTSAPVTLSGTDADKDPLTFTVITGPSHGTITGTPPDLVYTPVETHIGTDTLSFVAADGSSISQAATINFTITEVLTNGGFEQTTGTDPNTSPAGWTVSGNHQVKTSPPPREGSRLIALNTGNTTPNALLSQSFATTPGRPYTLQFDMGVQAFNNSQQRMRVSITGNGSLFSVLESLAGSGTTSNAVTTWTSKSYTFVANSTTTTLQFKDESIATAGIDLLLDKVRVSPQLSRLLTIGSNLAAGTTVTVSPADISGNSGGLTELKRRYLHATTVTLTAPATNDNRLFRKWLKNGTDWTTSASTQLTLDADSSLTAVYAPNEPPVATADSYATTEDSGLNVPPPGVMTNDADPDGQSLVAVLDSPTTRGSVSLNADGSFNYLPGKDFHGTDSFRYHLHDGLTRSESATVTIAVAPVNDPPVASPLSLAVDEDGGIEILLTGEDLDNTSLEFSTDHPTHGTLSGTPPNLVYRPAPDFHGTDRFNFTVHDGTTRSAPASVTIAVRPVNDPPSTQRIELALDEDGSIPITLTGTDPDDTLLAFAASQPANGMWIGSPPNLIYTPNPDFHGNDHFTFTVSDGKAAPVEATVTIEVRPVNDAPVVKPLQLTTDEDSAITITLDATDVDTNALEFTTTQPAHGTLSGTAPDLVYTPNENFHGIDEFNFTVSDGTAAPVEATVTIEVRPANDAPVAKPLQLTTDEDTIITITLDATDVDTSSLEFTTTQPAHGTLSGTAPNLVYTPNENFHGNDQFTFTVSDGTADPDEATVTIEVRPVNDAPVAKPGSIDARENESVDLRLEASDLEGGDLVFSIKTPPQQGVLSGVPPLLSYTPRPGFHGRDSFVFIVRDPDGASAEASVEIAVEKAPDPPFKIWLDSFGLTGSQGDDPDADSIPNVLEYAIGTDPSVADDATLLPSVALVNADPDGDSSPSTYLCVTYRRSDRASQDPAAVIVVERSTDPASGWQPADGRAGEVILTDDDASDHGVDTVRVFIPVIGNERGFARLRATLVQP